MNAVSGQLILFNKPRLWTSFDVIRKVRAVTGIRKVGHAGTLDPLATGLLIVCTGKMTRRLSEFQDLEKEYTGSIMLGETTPAYDRELPVNQKFPVDHISEEDIHTAARYFTGMINQVPPPHSAVRVEGKRSYTLARKGIATQLKPRSVEIKSFEITDIQFPEVFFKVVCSKGTYIRSLANDFGSHLKSGGCLNSLCRTRIGDFNLSDAWDPDQFANEHRPGE